MSDTIKGVLWMIGTIVSFSVMAVSGREASSELDTFELMLFRSILGLFIVMSFIAAQNRWSELRTDHIGAHIMRNLAHFTGQNLWFFALALIPLSQVFALEFTTPIWVMILSPLFLGEKMTATRALCAAIGFSGILIVTRPGAVDISWGVVSAASAAIFFATTIIFTKRLTQTDSIACILFYLTSLQLIFGLITAGYDGDIAIPSLSVLPHVIAVGIGGLVAHFCYTKALSLAPATIVSPIDFARLPAITIIAWLVYNEGIDAAVFIGAAIIFAGNYLNIWLATRTPSQKAPS